MPTYCLIIEYDGTEFHGWQSNPGVRTVQSTVADAIASMLGRPVKLSGASRTDAGVHALGQTACFSADTSIPAQGFRKGLNTALADDVAIRHCEQVGDDFDPRRMAVGKHYRYLIYNLRSRSPLNARSSWHRRGSLDVSAMRSAVPALLGEHDFSAFRSAHCSAPSPVRTLTRIEVERVSGGLVQLDVYGNAFLQHMVRNLAGTFMEVGQARRPPEDMARLLASRDRTQAGPTAPACGLTLMSVFYPDGVLGGVSPASEAVG